MAAGWTKELRNFFHVNRHLVALKATVFVFYAGFFSLAPFLYLHVNYVGLSMPETTTAYAILLIASFAGAPIAGFLTDKIGRFKLVFSMVLVGMTVSHNLLLLVPKVTVAEQPAQSEILCTSTGTYLFIESCQLPHIHCPMHDGGDNAVITFTSCQFLCIEPNDTAPFPHQVDDIDHLQTTLSSSAAFSTGTFANNGGKVPQLCFKTGYGYKAPQQCEPLRELVSVPADNFSLGSAMQMYDSKKQCVFRLMHAFWGDRKVYLPSCPVNPAGCRFHCNLNLRHLNESAFTCTERTGDPASTFYTYFTLRLICFVFLGAAFALTEAAILSIARKHRGDYGKQRVWGIIAKAAIVPLVAYFTRVARHSGLDPSIPAFVVFDIFMCLAFIMVVAVLRFDMSAQPKLCFRDVLDLLGRWDALLLYFAIFFLGAFWGFLDSFLPGFLLDLGSSRKILDLSRTIGGLVCIPTMFFADTIMNKVGRVNILVAAFICYSVEMLCYSLIGNPWWSLALEVLKFFTSCLKLASAVTLANNLAPSRLPSTMQGTLHCLQYLIGSGIGHLIGGIIADTYSTRAALRVFGIMSALLGFTYGVSYYAIRKKDAPETESRDAMNSYKPDPQFNDLCHTESTV